MLVLSRRVGESVEIPGLGVKFTLLKVKGRDAIRVGIEAQDGQRIIRTGGKNEQPAHNRNADLTHVGE